MTCETIVMNRKAVVLAADSAVTVTQWINGTEEKRYFKGVNKLFQISKKQPVGMMVYGSGDLQQAPWELLAKEYRDQLGDRAFDNLEQYAEDLFKFLQDNTNIYPEEYRDEVFMSDCKQAALVFYVREIASKVEYKEVDDNKEVAFSKKYLEETISNLDAEDFFSDGFTENDIAEAIKSFSKSLIEKIESHKIMVDGEKLAEFAIKAVYKRHYLMGQTGVVIAGFGKKDYFPSYGHYLCFGNMRDKIAIKKEEGFQISYHQHSHIEAFAMTDMVDTFRYGIGLQSYLHAGEECEKSLKKIVSDLGQDKAEGVEQLIKDSVESFRTNLLVGTREQNYGPLTRVIAALPIDDMVELAETLVKLESLKEKVTQPSESVGGPVDVAVISRGDGLVWIKRKHYFKPDINPRYFQRDSK